MSNEIDLKSMPAGKSNWRPIGLTLLWAALLGAGSCFGASASGDESLALILLAVSALCIVAFVVGLIWALVEFTKNS
jgi:hypothetical protein